jgi:hypothetical protein
VIDQTTVTRDFDRMMDGAIRRVSTAALDREIVVKFDRRVRCFRSRPIQ